MKSNSFSYDGKGNARYLSRPYFKNIFLYLVQTKLPSSKAALRQRDTQAENYLLPDS